MNNSPSAILAAINSTLTASPSLVPATIKQIKLGRDADRSGGYPFVRIYLMGIENPSMGVQSYQRIYRYGIEIWQEITAKTKSDAEIDFENAVHAVLNRLSGTGTPPTWQLGIGVENTQIEVSEIRTAEENSGPAVVAALKFSVMTLIQNPS